MNNSLSVSSSGRGRHEAGPIDEVLSKEVEQADLECVFVGVREIDQRIEEVRPRIDEGKQPDHR